MPDLKVLFEMDDQNQCIGEAECCGEKFIFEVLDKAASIDRNEVSLVNMTFPTGSHFPHVRCPKCRTVEKLDPADY